MLAEGGPREAGISGSRVQVEGVGLVTSSVTIEKWEVCPGREVCVQGVRKSKEEG